MSSITHNLDSLFDKWQADFPQNEAHHNFIKDGVVDEKEWGRQELKVLFVLKEANDARNSISWDLREKCREKGVEIPGKTWIPVSSWCNGIFNGFSPWKENQKVDFSIPEERKKWLCKVAVMNIKKSGGPGNSDFSQLESAVKESIGLIKKEIQIIGPDIIVACGTYYFLSEIIYENDPDSEKGSLINGVDYTINHRENWLIVDFYHPAARVRANFLYTMLMDTVKEAIKIIK